jgi:hypothetical protein
VVVEDGSGLGKCTLQGGIANGREAELGQAQVTPRSHTQRPSKEEIIAFEGIPETASSDL